MAENGIRDLMRAGIMTQFLNLEDDDEIDDFVLPKTSFTHAYLSLDCANATNLLSHMSNRKLFNSSRQFFVSSGNKDAAVSVLAQLNINLDSRIILHVNGDDSQEQTFMVSSVERWKNTTLHLNALGPLVGGNVWKGWSAKEALDLDGHIIFICANVGLR